jgi:hypothetical protein
MTLILLGQEILLSRKYVARAMHLSVVVVVVVVVVVAAAAAAVEIAVYSTAENSNS